MLAGGVMRVCDLIKELGKYDGDLEVYDCSGYEVEGVEEKTWTDNNYPYDKPDKQIVVIL